MTAEAYGNLTWSFEVPPEPVDDSQLVETIADDVIVIGSGVSGLMAAASVLGHGGSCTLFSAGTKAVSRGGSNHAVGTKTQARLGLAYTPDTVAAHFNNEIARQGYRMDSRKWWKWINESGEAMDWVTDIMEAAGYTTTLELPYADPNGTFSIPSGAHNFYGPEIQNSANDGEPLLTATLEQYILDNGGSIRYNTKAEYLVRENDNTGRVSSVIATNEDGEYVKFEGSKAIIMATGDFSGDPDMMAKYCNAFADYVAESAGDYDAEFQFGGLMPGDGQKMGLWVGAAWQNTTPSAPMIGWYGFPAPCSDQNHPGILLNVEGQRFINEDTTSVYAGYAISGQTDKKVFTVWDSAFAHRFDTWGGPGQQHGQPRNRARLRRRESSRVRSWRRRGHLRKGRHPRRRLESACREGRHRRRSRKSHHRTVQRRCGGWQRYAVPQVQRLPHPHRPGSVLRAVQPVGPPRSSCACSEACGHRRTARYATKPIRPSRGCTTWDR